jgi:hypothetical protein
LIARWSEQCIGRSIQLIEAFQRWSVRGIG